MNNVYFSNVNKSFVLDIVQYNLLNCLTFMFIIYEAIKYNILYYYIGNICNLYWKYR